ncbi:Histone-lysine N-methyltransferase SETMAR [Habropoda laboriosa]|uniref:Histone-lysine N-methyltransferase SETMAR n=1 Tax=Habropoda laboriosa TaxID=597456 RepID=A0A0L7RK93_9HYME|nr:Histone-lysine N-methyltransferase SETMAR [Habropoda laboriosa]
MHKKLFVRQASLVNRKGPILLHDNTLSHVSQFTIRKIHELGYETLKHPPYSPDLAPTGYHFLKHLDNFRNKEDAVNTSVEFINSTTPDSYCNGIGTLAKRWKKCIESNGNYFFKSHVQKPQFISGQPNTFIPQTSDIKQRHNEPFCSVLYRRCVKRNYKLIEIKGMAFRVTSKLYQCLCPRTGEIQILF